MKDLFANYKAMQFRDSKGRFATAERAYADREHEENKMLRLQIDKLTHEREKYFRAWMACADSAARLNRELVAVKAELRTLKQS